VAADGLRFDRFNADVASLGHIAGAGTIDARNKLHFGMVATLPTLTRGGTGAVGTAGTLGGLLGTIAGVATSRTIKIDGIPFLVEGTTSNPEFIPDLSGVALHMLQQQFGALALPR